MRNSPSFRDYEIGPNFDRARSQIATPFQYLDIALDTALNAQQYNVSGDFIYIDTAFGGVATIELNNQQDAPVAPFKVQAGFALNALFKSIKVTASAQPGEKIRIMYSTGERVIPALSGSLAVTGTVATLEDPFTYGASYKSITALAANTPETIVSPGANLNGIELRAARFLTNQSGAARLTAAILAKASAPTTVIDGDVIVGANNSSGATDIGGELNRAVFIPAGKGLYYIASGAENASGVHRSALYNLL